MAAFVASRDAEPVTAEDEAPIDPWELMGPVAW
jgi:hypothetical protein